MRSKRKKALSLIIHDIYCSLYQSATPSANFDELVENAEILPDGRKDIHFENYEIEDEVMDSIINYHISLYRLTEMQKKSIKVNVYLGCSPRTKLKI